MYFNDPMKTAAVLHGKSCNPEMFWYRYAEDVLRKEGYNVWLPTLPASESADRTIWVPFIQEHFTFTEESILVGHSASNPVILEILETLPHPVQKVILVAGFAKPLNNTPHPSVKDSYDWKKIGANIRELYIINSDNDPYGADHHAGRYIFEKLHGTQIIMHGERHFGSIRFNQPYKEFPLLKRLLVAV